MLTLVQPTRRGQPFAGMPIFSLAPTAPITVLSVSINSSGSETTVVYSRVANVPDAIGYTLGGITGITLSSPTGSGSDDTWGFTNSRTILRGESPVLNYSGTGTVDTDNNLLQPFTAFPITNLSEVLPVPTGLIATPGNGLVDLRWVAIDPAQDGERIERSTDGITFAPIHDKSTDGVTYTNDTAVNGTLYWYRIKTFVTSPALESAASNVAGPVTPTSIASADGYYAKHAKMKLAIGRINLAIGSNLDSDGTDEDQQIIQGAMDRVDRKVDGMARREQLPVATPHMFTEDDVDFGEISDVASDMAAVKVMQARGIISDASDKVGGQLADLYEKAEQELKDILAAKRVAQLLAVGSDGAAVLTRPCNPYGYRGPLSGWRRW